MDGFDGTLGLAGFDIIADAKGVVDKEKEPRDDVLDEILGSQTDGQPQDARPGKKRRDVNADRREENQTHNHQENDEDELAEHFGSGVPIRLPPVLPPLSEYSSTS